MKKAKGDNNESSKDSCENLQNEDLTTREGQKDENADTTVEETDKAIDSKDQQIADLSDKFIRLAAEYDNFRRRSQKEKEALYNDSIATVASAWLPVVDNLERAVMISSEYKHEESKKIKSGVDMVLQQAKDSMNSLGITEIEAKGNPFDPNTMEAIMHVDDENAGEAEVVEVFTKGYKRGEKIIRHAIVKVAN